MNATLRRFILEHLLLADPMPLTARILHGGAGTAIHPEPTLSEVERALKILESSALVTSVRDNVDETLLRYSLTRAGQTEASRK